MMTNEQEEIIVALKKMDDGDSDATYFRQAQYVLNREQSIKEHPEEWVEICSCHKGQYTVWSESDKAISFSKCQNCNGSGLIAKERNGL